MDSIFLFISSIIVLENVLFFYLQYKRYRFVSMTSYTAIFLFIMYIVFPIFYMYKLININEVYDVSFAYSDVSNILVISNIIILFFYTSFFTAYYIKSRAKYVVVNCMSNQSVSRHIKIIFIVSILFFFIYIFLYGGFEYVLSNISAIRSGHDESKSYIGMMARMFSDYIIIVYFSIFYSLIKVRNKKESYKKLLFFFIFLTCIVLFKKYIDGGRGGIITIFIGLYIIFVITSKKLHFKYVTVLLGLAFFVIIYGKIVLFQLFTEQNVSFSYYTPVEIINKILLEFAYPYVSLINVLNLQLGADRLFLDFVVWVLKPLKLLGYDEFDSISYYNTYHLIGMWESNIPPGIVAFLFLEGGIFFIPLGSFFFGYLFSYIDIMFAQFFRMNNSFFVALTVIMFLQMPRIILSSDFALFIMSSMVYLLLIIYLFLFKRFRIYRT